MPGMGTALIQGEQGRDININYEGTKKRGKAEFHFEKMASSGAA